DLYRKTVRNTAVGHPNSLSSNKRYEFSRLFGNPSLRYSKHWKPCGIQPWPFLPDPVPRCASQTNSKDIRAGLSHSPHQRCGGGVEDVLKLCRGAYTLLKCGDQVQDEMIIVSSKLLKISQLIKTKTNY